jgi:hypothetical protein
MVELTVLRAVALRVADEESSADDSVPILEAATEIERLRVQLAKADAIVFLIDASMRRPDALPIPFNDVKECLDRHRTRISGMHQTTPDPIDMLEDVSNNRFQEIPDTGARSQSRRESPKPRSRSDDDQPN